MIRQYPPTVGGAEIQAQRLAEELVRRGHPVRVLTGRWRGDLPAEDLDRGVWVCRLGTLWNGFGLPGLRRFGQQRYLHALGRELARSAPDSDVIHVHQILESAVVATRAASVAGVPTIGTMCSSGCTSDISVLRDRCGDHVWTELCSGLTRLVALSAPVERDAVEAGFPPERIVRIPNGVPLPDWRKEDYRGDRQIVCVSRCRPEKGLDVLVKAFGHLSKTMAGLSLHLVGGGEERAALEGLASITGVRQSVLFYGDVDDVTQHLRDADVFVLPSHTEGMSNALLEAMAAGLPCVATRVGGNPELIEDGVTGVLCEPGDPRALAQALKRMLVDEELRRRAGEAARRRIEEHYAMGAVATRYQALYAEVCGGTP